MFIDTEMKLDFKDVLIRPKRSTLPSRNDVLLLRRHSFHTSGHYDFFGLPIVAANMDGVGTYEMGDAMAEHKAITCLTKHYTLKSLLEYYTTEDRTLFVAYSMGIGEQDLQKWEAFKAACSLEFLPLYVCIDVANGYTENFVNFIRKFREKNTRTIIAGNVVTREMTEQLIINGADIVKVGIGPGSVCTTRIQTGVGYPQLSAIIECADAAHGLGGHIMADGGCTCPGDIAKAFAAGADFVMLGGMLAGHDEGGGEIIEKRLKTGEVDLIGSEKTELKKFVKFYGMASNDAMMKHFGSLVNYRSSEGKTVEIPYRGSIYETMKNIMGGLRSTLTYVGAKELKHLSKCTTFIRVTEQHNRIFE